MKVSGIETSLDRFLKIKKAAEKRLNTGNPVKEKKIDKTDGLLSVYNINQILGKSLFESPAKSVLMKNKHLGNFFDGVA